jgi:hypothetical protein
MHKTYGGDGLTAVSVSFDNPADADERARVNAFLQKQGATMTNVIAEGDTDDWYKKLNAGALPLVYIFDRQNRRVKKLEGEQVDYKAIEAEVAKLLRK